MKRSIGRFDERTDGDSPGYGIIVVGASWGGLEAVRTILGGLPADFDIPIAVVQHRHRDSHPMLGRFLRGHTTLQICDVEDKMPVAPRRVFVAPPDYHTLVERGHFSLSTEEPVRYSRPSIDVTLMSAAAAYAHHAAGAILTGANTDGAEGLKRLAEVGGLPIVQDPESAEIATMPRAAIAAVPNARVFALDRLASFLATLPSAYAQAPPG